MAHSLKELSASLREAIQRGAAFTVGIEHDPYPVSGVLVGGDRILTAAHLVGDGETGVHLPEGRTATAKTVARDTVKGRQDGGLLLVMVERGSAAEAAGMAVGDILVSFGGSPVADHESLVAAIADCGDGATVDAEVLRGGVLRALKVTVGGA